MTYVRMGGDRTGKNVTVVVDRCNVDDSLLVGCQQTLRHTDKHLLGCFLVCAADFTRERNMQNVLSLTKAEGVRKQCNKSLYNCTMTEPTNTVMKLNVAMFCIKCVHVILQSSVVQRTNEIHDPNDSFHRLLQAPSSCCTQGLLVNNAVIRQQLWISNSLTELRYDRNSTT